MKRRITIFVGCLLLIPSFPPMAAATTTTVPQRESADMSAMEWVQSLGDDPAFAGFTVEQSVIIVAQVRGREFVGPVPASASVVEFVDAGLSQREFNRGRVRATALLQEVSPSVVGISYDPLTDHIKILRLPEPEAIAALTNAAIDEVMTAAFGLAAEQIDHHIEVTQPVETSPGPSIPPEGAFAEDIEVSVLCEDGRAAWVRERGAWGLIWPRPGRVPGQEFGTEWDWSCRVLPPDTAGTDRLIYALLGLVVVLGAGLIWAFSAKSNLERQLWAISNPKSQQAI